MKIAVVILAGGEGSRIGGGKPLRLLGGKRLIDHAEALASQWSELIAVVVRTPAQVGSTSLTRILDEDGIEGPLAGLAAALRFARDNGCQALLTIPADMPFLPRDLGKRLTAVFEGYAAAVASSGGKLHPVCGLWRASVLELLPTYIASGRRSLTGFAEAVGFRRAEWANVPQDDFFNINSADDLATAERLLKR